MKKCIERIAHSATTRKTRRFISVYLRFALCISVLQFLSIRPLHAQQGSAPDDRTPIRVRYPAPDRLRDLQTDHDYQYTTDAPPPENPVARFFDWFFRKLSNFLTSKAYQNVWQYIILAAVTGLVIYLLMKAEVLRFLYPGRPQSDSLDYETLTENIHQINFNAAVDEAVANRNFRLAVRLLYLQTLKRLTDGGYIDYKPDKTNRQYVRELSNSPIQTPFEQLTRQFEFVWYGDFPIDEAQFTQIRQQFQLVTRPRPQHS